MEWAILTEEVEFRRNLALFLLVKLSSHADGTLTATKVEMNGSGDFAALAGADGFLEFPAAQDRIPAGFVARLHRFGESL